MITETPIVPAPWLAETLKNVQAASDLHSQTSGIRYQFELSKSNWIAENVRNRETGLPLTKFSAPIPQRVVFFATSPTTWSQRTEPDPGVTMPELPPAPVVTPATPLKTEAGQQDAQIQQVLGLILAKLIALEARLPK